MKTFLIGAAILTAVVPDVLGQTAPRFTIGPVARVERVAVEAGLKSTMPVFGVSTAVRLSKTWGLEGEITRAAGAEFVHSYEGVSQTFADPRAPQEEIERLGVRARWRFGYRAGVGGFAAATAKGAISDRVDLVLRFGLAVRNYTETAAFTILSIPPGIDPSRVASVSYGGDENGASTTQRGGLLIGFDVPVRVTRRLSVSPTLHYVYGGPARIGNKHREMSVGLRGAWGL